MLCVSTSAEHIGKEVEKADAGASSGLQGGLIQDALYCEWGARRVDTAAMDTFSGKLKDGVEWRARFFPFSGQLSSSSSLVLQAGEFQQLLASSWLTVTEAGQGPSQTSMETFDFVTYFPYFFPL